MFINSENTNIGTIVTLMILVMMIFFLSIFGLMFGVQKCFEYTFYRIF